MPTSRRHQRQLVDALKGLLEPEAVSEDTSNPRLPEPRKVGRHKPDARALLPGLDLRFDSKLGPEVGSRHSKEQFYDFTKVPGQGGRTPVFVLATPPRYQPRALRALIEAKGDPNRVVLFPRRPQRPSLSSIRAARRLTGRVPSPPPAALALALRRRRRLGNP